MNNDYLERMRLVLDRVGLASGLDLRNEWGTALVTLGLTSLKFIALVVEIEREFQFQFDDEDVKYERLSSVGAIHDYLVKGARVALS